MAISFLNSREPGATTAALILDEIELGQRYLAVAEQSRFYRGRRIDAVIGATIRACNQALGMAGNFKNGCLYRESSLSERWSKETGEVVVLDHATPITELVKRHKLGEPIAQLMLSPVVRISKSSNDGMTRKGYAKAGHKAGFPLYRYARAGISIVTHSGTPIDPATWTDEEHWNFVRETPELRPILDALEIECSTVEIWQIGQPLRIVGLPDQADNDLRRSGGGVIGTTE
ncbi:MAG TPA: hypothetical protein VK165_03715 [Azonexus sp.]|nr:hypothetical protein [Azonexus sp.]